jgi:hypothetical protein
MSCFRPNIEDGTPFEPFTDWAKRVGVYSEYKFYMDAVLFRQDAAQMQKAERKKRATAIFNQYLVGAISPEEVYLNERTIRSLRIDIKKVRTQTSKFLFYTIFCAAIDWGA